MYDYDDVPIVNPHRKVHPGLGPTIGQATLDIAELPELPGYPACAGTDPEIFFPPVGNASMGRQAKRICAGCPIMVWCRDTHIDEHYGIWGGLTEMQRRAARARRRLPESQRVDDEWLRQHNTQYGKVKCDMAFQKVEVPAGSYMGWSNSKPGQIFEGTVVEYDETGGTDFKKDPCPLLVVKLTRKATSVNKENERTTYEVGEELSLTAGQANLKKAVKKAHRDYGLDRGVLVRIELDHFEKVPDGKVKVFDVQVDTSTRDTSAPSDDDHDSGGGSSADDDEPPF